MDKKVFRWSSGFFGLLASLLFVAWVFQTTHTATLAVLYTSFAFLAYALASYLLLNNSANKYVRLVPVVYLGFGLAMVYAVVVLAGGSRTFLYLAVTTAVIAAISYFYAAYATGYGRTTSNLGIKSH